MSASMNRVTTRSQSRAIKEFSRRRLWGSSPGRGVPVAPYIFLDRVDSLVADKLSVKRKNLAGNVKGDAKRRKTEKTGKIPRVSAKRCDVCHKNEENSGNSISKIPMEILSEIFRKLSCQDRCNAKLVCRTWYNACNTTSITSTQKMACSKSRKLQSFMTTLERSRLKWLNVEFRCTSFDLCRKSFWSRVGDRIRSLQFVDCELNSEVIGCVGRHCSKLQHLSWEYRNPGESSSMVPFRDVPIDHLYPKLISKTPFLGLLTSLHLHILNVHNVVDMGEDRFLMAVLAKYPNLRSLHVKLLPGRTGSILLPLHEALFKQLLNSRLETLTFARGRLYLEGDIPHIEQLPINHTLRELRFAVWKCDSKIQSYFVQKFQGLKHLEFCDIFGNEVLQDIWRYQTGLSSIILNWLQCSDYGFSGEVTEGFDDVEEWDRFPREPGYCVNRLSKLEKMKIILVEKPDRLTENVLSYFIFPKLRCLDISLWTINMQFTLKFLKHLSNFTNLEELHVHYDKPVPYFPWMKALRNLKKLRDVFLEEKYTIGFGDRQYKRFFSSLPQLRRLEHRYIRTQVRWTRDSEHDEPKKIVFSPFVN